MYVDIGEELKKWWKSVSVVRRNLSTSFDAASSLSYLPLPDIPRAGCSIFTIDAVRLPVKRDRVPPPAWCSSSGGCVASARWSAAPAGTRRLSSCRCWPQACLEGRTGFHRGASIQFVTDSWDSTRFGLASEERPTEMGFLKMESVTSLLTFSAAYGFWASESFDKIIILIQYNHFFYMRHHCDHLQQLPFPA